MSSHFAQLTAVSLGVLSQDSKLRLNLVLCTIRWLFPSHPPLTEKGIFLWHYSKLGPITQKVLIQEFDTVADGGTIQDFPQTVASLEHLGNNQKIFSRHNKPQLVFIVACGVAWIWRYSKTGFLPVRGTGAKGEKKDDLPHKTEMCSLSLQLQFWGKV